MPSDFNWLEIRVTTSSEAAEAVSALLNRHVYGGAVIEMLVDQFEHELETAPPDRVIVKGYLPLDGQAGEVRHRVEEGLWHLSQIMPIPEPQFHELAEADWAQAWKQQYHRLHIGKRLVIVPLWEEYEAHQDEAVILLEPGMAFGTGMHPTTRQCLELVESHLARGASMLDVGTGSGILAIAAAKLGARSVLAIDADPVAVTTARENVETNRVSERVSVRHASLPGGDAVPRQFLRDGGLEVLSADPFDLVVVNILAPVIMGMAPALAPRMAPGGLLIVAGLIDRQAAEVTAALDREGLKVIQQTAEKDWVAMVLRHRRVV